MICLSECWRGDNYMLVTKEMMKKFARYEISGDELFTEEYEVEENY